MKKVYSFAAVAMIARRLITKSRTTVVFGEASDVPEIFSGVVISEASSPTELENTIRYHFGVKLSEKYSREELEGCDVFLEIKELASTTLELISKHWGNASDDAPSKPTVKDAEYFKDLLRQKPKEEETLETLRDKHAKELDVLFVDISQKQLAE